MPLPGYLCIGILEEDNPQKSYFRFKPLLIEKDGKYEPYADYGAYPEDGCIRIVPDKNESSHFKVRMREVGRYCMADLRDHPGDSDKIRPNKNFKGDGVESNGYIIYSDVLQFPPENSIFEVLPVDAAADSAQMALVIEPPATHRVLVRRDGVISGSLWTHMPMREPEGGVSLTKTEQSLDLNEMQEFTLKGFGNQELHFLIRMPAQAEKPSERALPKEEKPSETEQPRQAAVPEATEDKPWISRAEPVRTPRENPNMSPFDKALAAQCGMNPRRGRSLQEIIDDKWRHSRLDQLGTPVPGQAMGTPAASPVEAAVEALRNAWSIPSARHSLMQELCRLREFREAAEESQKAMQNKVLTEQLNAMEARKLELTDELERMEKNGDSMRSVLKTKIRQEDAAEFADVLGKIEAAKNQLTQVREDTDAVRKAAVEAEKRFVRATGDQLRQRLLDTMLDDHVVRMALDLRDSRIDPLPAIPAVRDASDLIDILSAKLAAAGLDGSKAFAANLLCCAAISPVTVLSGAIGSGKTAAVRILAEVLGLKDCGRFAEVQSLDDDKFRALADAENEEIPAIALLDDANSDIPEEPLENPENRCLRLMYTVQDADEGCPLTAHLLDRAFFVRMSPESADTPWILPEAGAESADAPVSMESLRAAFASRAAIPDDIRQRMESLRADLGAKGVRFSRRCLNAMAEFIGAMLPLNVFTPDQLLDLAIAQRALPALLASAPLETLVCLPDLLNGMPICLELIRQPLPIRV